MEARFARKACVAASDAASLGGVLTTRDYSENNVSKVGRECDVFGRIPAEKRTGFEVALLRWNMVPGGGQV